jgi:integrase
MHQSTRRRPANKPAKPYADFPLFAHATGRWAKKIRGKMCYFGPWADPGAALNRYLSQRDDLFAGRTPRAQLDGMTVREVCNRYLTSKQQLRDSGEIDDRTFNDYYSACERMLACINGSRIVADLTPHDFEQLRSDLSKTLGTVALGNAIQRVRMVFKYAYDQGFVERPIRYGQTFRKPSVKSVRQDRARRTQERGHRMFEAVAIQKILQHTEKQLKAMTLLGINCAFGQTEISRMPMSVLDLKTGWVTYPRTKTGVERRCPLWPETVAALREVLAMRPKPRDAKHEDLVFITKYGQPWVKTNKKGTPADAIGQEFSKVLTQLGLKRRGISFYALRHPGTHERSPR